MVSPPPWKGGAPALGADIVLTIGFKLTFQY